MPYVEVWIDEPDCDGQCASADEAKRLEAIIDEAASHLQAGDQEAALSTLREEPLKLTMKTPREIAAAYKAWQAGALPGFTNFRKEAGA